ncbi:MAG: hypothetical protein ASARMPRED_001148 [Alectoria sarmentosa]|nr:MAG: hypothetical protein ASARMPRED_001148 [Alectoria sarmentosa]
MAASNPPLPAPPADGDRNRGSSILVTETIFVAIGTILVLARLYVRSHIIRRLGLDDLFIVLGLIFAIVVLALDGVMVHNGVGRHQFYLELSPELLLQLSQAIKWQYISQIVLILSTMFTKVSICFFLLRIFGTKPMWKRGLYAIMAFAVVTNISSASIVLAQCSPVQKLWDPLMPGTCWGPDTEISIGDYNGAVSVFCDWALASLPIVFMWNLQMSIKLKVGICVLMGMGFFLEETIGIIAACIPTLKPLFDTSLRFPWSTRGWSRKLAGEESGPSHNSEEDDKRRLQPAPQHNVHLNTFPVNQDAYLRDDGRERNRVEIKGGGQESRSTEGLGLGRDGIRMETEFGSYKGDVLDDFDRV